MQQESGKLVLKKRVVLANKVLGHWYNLIGLGYMLMHLGHVSARIPGQNLLFLRGRPAVNDLLIRTMSRDVLTIDFDGNRIEGAHDVSLPSEAKLHTNLYKARSDVGGVCHAHPHWAVLASVLEIPLKPLCSEGLDILPVATFEDNALILSDEQGKSLAKVLGKGTACVLRGHGAVTIGTSPEKAVLNMIYLEEQARLNLCAVMAVGRNYSSIPEEQVALFLESVQGSSQRQRIGQKLWEYLVEDAKARKPR